MILNPCFEVPARMVNNVSHFVNILVNKSLQLVMRSAAELDTGEQVTNQRKEERLVLVDKFRQIHVSQYSHNNTFFCIIGIFTFFSSEGTKDLMKVRNFEFGDLLNSHTSEVLYYLRWRVVSVKTIKFQRIWIHHILIFFLKKAVNWAIMFPKKINSTYDLYRDDPPALGSNLYEFF